MILCVCENTMMFIEPLSYRVRMRRVMRGYRTCKITILCYSVERLSIAKTCRYRLNGELQIIARLSTAATVATGDMPPVDGGTNR